MQRDLELAHKLETSDFSAFLINWYDQPIFASLKKHPNFERLLQSRLRNNPIQLAQSLRDLSSGCQPSLWDNLKLNENPLLLLVGEYDEKFIAINLEMANFCKSVTLKIVNNSGHNIHFENINEFVLNVRSFLI